MASSSDDTSSTSSSSNEDDHPESYYDSWSRGPWRWEGVTRVRQLVNTSILEMQRVRWSAQAVASSHVRRANGPGALALRKLRHIQDSLATAPTIMRGDMHWLILVMVGNRPDQPNGWPHSRTCGECGQLFSRSTGSPVRAVSVHNLKADVTAQRRHRGS